MSFKLFNLKESDLIKLDEYEQGYERIKLVVYHQVTEKLTELIEANVYYKKNLDLQYLPSNDYLMKINIMLNERLGNHKKNIIIRGIINEEIKEIGYWNPSYGIKLNL